MNCFCWTCATLLTPSDPLCKGWPRPAGIASRGRVLLWCFRLKNNCSTVVLIVASSVYSYIRKGIGLWPYLEAGWLNVHQAVVRFEFSKAPFFVCAHYVLAIMLPLFTVDKNVILSLCMISYHTSRYAVGVRTHNFSCRRYCCPNMCQ